MFEVREYVDGNMIHSETLYGVYEENHSEAIVFCYSETSAKIIVDVLNNDKR